jgi:hypothetical protein
MDGLFPELSPEPAGTVTCQSCGDERPWNVQQARAAGWRVWRDDDNPRQNVTLCRRCAAGDLLTGSVYYDRSGRETTL